MPSENRDETECEASIETLIEDITDPETLENYTLCEPVTEEMFFETEVVIQDEIIPKLLISKLTDTDDPDYSRYKITVTPWKKCVVCGILLILHTEGDGGIYDVTIENMPSKICFSYIINIDKTAVLIDGIIKDDETNSEISFYVLVKKDAGKLCAEVLDYQEIA